MSEKQHESSLFLVLYNSI